MVASTEGRKEIMWLIVGGNGQLGRSLTDVLVDSNQEFVATSHSDLDITDTKQVNEFFSGRSFSVVINCAAWTAVDDAEDHIADALRVNYEGPRNLANAAIATESRLIHISTDYVFAGDATEPYEIDTPPNPLNAYGRTKQMGDSTVLTIGSGQFPIVRTAWLYSKYGRNFAKTMTNRALQGQSVQVVNDQLGQPTSAADLAHLIVEIARHPSPPSIVHGTNSGQASWFEFAKQIYQFLDVNPDLVTSVTSEAFLTKAPRPRYSVLGHAAFHRNGLTEMRDWKSALSSEIGNIRHEIEREIQ